MRSGNLYVFFAKLCDHIHQYQYQGGLPLSSKETFHSFPSQYPISLILCTFPLLVIHICKYIYIYFIVERWFETRTTSNELPSYYNFNSSLEKARSSPSNPFVGFMLKRRNYQNNYKGHGHVQLQFLEDIHYLCIVG